MQASISVEVEPFGLGFRDPVPPECTVSRRSTNPYFDDLAVSVVRDQQRRMPMFNGRPSSKLSAEDRAAMVDSSPTETDGKDPLTVDSDPFYD
jgi:hypothetical protein